MKTKAPKAIQPVLQGPAKDALPQFLRGQEAFAKLVDSAEESILRACKFRVALCEHPADEIDRGVCDGDGA